ncbi:MAG: hypothetical protein U5L00_19025 [Desulfovermiculus sp.]|nr:hypothetical protein [Desulfovermiculus sp.]
MITIPWRQYQPKLSAVHRHLLQQTMTAWNIPFVCMIYPSLHLQHSLHIFWSWAHPGISSWARIRPFNARRSLWIVIALCGSYANYLCILFFVSFISTDVGAQEKIEASELWDVPYSGFSEVKSDTTSDIGLSGSQSFMQELTNFQFEYGLQLPPDIMNNIDYSNTTYHAAQNILKSNKLSPEERIFHTEIFLRSRNNEITLNFISQVAQDQLISWATGKAIDKLGVSDSINMVADPLGTVESKVIDFVSPLAGQALDIIAKSIELREFFNNREQYRSFYTEVMEWMDESRGLNREKRDDYVADLDQKIQKMKHDLYDIANQAHTQIKDIAKKVGMPPEFQNEAILYALGYGAGDSTGPGQRKTNQERQERFERYLLTKLTPGTANVLENTNRKDCPGITKFFQCLYQKDSSIRTFEEGN